MRVSGVCNVPVFPCAYRPWGTQAGSAGRLVRGRVGVTSDAIRTAQAARPQEAQGKPTPRQVPSTVPSTCSKIGKLGRLPHLPACLPTELQLKDPVPRCRLVLELLLSVVAAWRPTRGPRCATLDPDLQVLGLADCGTLTSAETL